MTLTRAVAILSSLIIATSLLYHSDAFGQISPPPVSYPIPVAKGGTGQTSAANAINGLLPSQTGNNGKFLTTDGSVASWAAVGGGSGTVTDVSVVSANGFAGSVATSTTTPAITLSTSITGLLLGNGTSVSAAVNSDLPSMTATVGGAVPTPPNDSTKYLDGTGAWSVPAGGGGGGPTITSFTPGVAASGMTITLTNAIGYLVTFSANYACYNFRFEVSAKSGTDSTLTVTGLPTFGLSSSLDEYHGTWIMTDGQNGSNPFYLVTVPGTPVLYVIVLSGSSTALSSSNILKVGTKVWGWGCGYIP